MSDSPIPKSCPRCRGLMVVESDCYGRFGCCIICGYHHEPRIITSEELVKEGQRFAGMRGAHRPSHGGVNL